MSELGRWAHGLKGVALGGRGLRGGVASKRRGLSECVLGRGVAFEGRGLGE